MVSATFRFYDQLGAFLPRERRGREFAAPCAREATTKHMIEALGVPHTEVALVLVNGESSGFEQMLRDGDRVAVYPDFGQLDVTALQRLRSWPEERLRFVADAHLGGLARLLRMAGYDTLYDNAYHDDEIERIARGEGRVLLTRDRELLKRRTVELGCYLHALRPEEQLRTVRPPAPGRRHAPVLVVPALQPAAAAGRQGRGAGAPAAARRGNARRIHHLRSLRSRVLEGLAPRAHVRLAGRRGGARA
jgi:hypothetical protein